MPRIGDEVGPIGLLTAVTCTDEAIKVLARQTSNFIARCERTGVKLSPLRLRVRMGLRMWTFSQKFRVDAVDPSKFSRRYEDEFLEMVRGDLGLRGWTAQ